MTMTMYCALRAVGSLSNGPSAPKGVWLSAEKVLVMMTKVDCKTVRIFAYSSTREQSNKRSGTRLKTESETWGETLKETRAQSARETWGNLELQKRLFVS